MAVNILDRDGTPVFSVHLDERVCDCPSVLISGSDGYFCTRDEGHGGEHSATGTDGRIYATWSDEDAAGRKPDRRI